MLQLTGILHDEGMMAPISTKVSRTFFDQNTPPYVRELLKLNYAKNGYGEISFGNGHGAMMVRTAEYGMPFDPAIETFLPPSTEGDEAPVSTVVPGSFVALISSPGYRSIVTLFKVVSVTMHPAEEKAVAKLRPVSVRDTNATMCQASGSAQDWNLTLRQSPVLTAFLRFLTETPIWSSDPPLLYRLPDVQQYMDKYVTQEILESYLTREPWKEQMIDV